MEDKYQAMVVLSYYVGAPCLQHLVTRKLSDSNGRMCIYPATKTRTNYGMHSSTIFEPKGDFNSLDAHLDQIPRYLIRTTSPGSQGINDKTYIGSAAARANLNQDDLFTRDFPAMKLMVERHLRWDESFKGDNLVSWSSSLLFVLHHAMQRQARDPGPTAFKDVLIMVLDTRKLPRGTFIATQALLDAFNIESVDECRYEFCQMEYFTQGTLDLSKAYADGGLVHMTMEDIIRLGLFELHPSFRERHFDQQLSLRCLEHRELFQQRPLAATQSEISIAETIAAGACTLPTFRPVVMIMLLSMWPRCRNDNVILQAFRKNKMGSIVSRDTLEDYSAISTTVPEYRQFVLTMHDVHANAQRYSRKRVLPKLTKENYFFAGFMIMLIEHGHLFLTTMLVLFTSLRNAVRPVYLPAWAD